ncbi:MAG: glycoside hydrolase family 2 TIM barrel-domain containing protein [Oscillospiraceae bacterium]
MKQEILYKILACVLEALVGVLLLVKPVGFTSAILVGAGILLVVYGLIELVRYFRMPVEEAAKKQPMSKGLFLVMLGVVCMVFTEWFITTFTMLTILYGIALLLSGLAKVQWSVDLFRLKKGRWALAAVSAVITLVCSAVIIGNPFSSTKLLWMFTGIVLTVEAVFDIVILILGGRKASDKTEKQEETASAETGAAHSGEESLRKVVNLNLHWAFSKEAASPPAAFPENWQSVTLPHTWNAEDGQDGGNDYYRGTCFYARKLLRSELPDSQQFYLEFLGANSSADVYMNGVPCGHHDGGYSTWRVNVTDCLQDENLLVVAVDNSSNASVYPQSADFTFYGGLYRDVNMICVGASHFDLDTFGGPGIKVTPVLRDEDADVEIEVSLTNIRLGQSLLYRITDAAGGTIALSSSVETTARLTIRGVHRWHGRKDPYLYTCTAELLENDRVLDRVSTRFGCRTLAVDPEKGFLLNGEEYPLRGVARHQDWKGIGNALRPEHHLADMDLICEMGANTIRLAHYQHSPYFYDLCDERGMIVWAEIPYISQHMPGGRENTISQLTELITQNYNHPSIVVWGLSNEISMKGADDPDLIENHRILNDLAHKLDKTRLTTLAVLSTCPVDSEYIHIPDTVSYNHYFGWYGGSADMYGPWFDGFHAKYPEVPIGCSEYGCEALNWHTSDPQPGDYTEEYQAYYHEELIKQLFPRKYLWATHVWNMFDFGADARNEGGEDGQNHKGLVTFDRKYKKDAFYAYKAWLSEEPFVHICGKRYVDRVEETAKITVYSNQPVVELRANGQSLGRKKAADHFFRFDVPNVGETTLTAIAGKQTDTSTIRKVETFNEDYRLKDKNAVLNWFDITMPEGCLSLNDKLGDVLAVPEGKRQFLSFLGERLPEGTADAASMDDMLKLLDNFTLLRLLGMLSSVNVQLSKEELLELNQQLNQIRKNQSCRIETDSEGGRS